MTAGPIDLIHELVSSAAVTTPDRTAIDAGRPHDGGRLVVVDRRKDVIITGGENAHGMCCSSKPSR